MDEQRLEEYNLAEGAGDHAAVELLFNALLHECMHVVPAPRPIREAAPFPVAPVQVFSDASVSDVSFRIWLIVAVILAVAAMAVTLWVISG